MSRACVFPPELNLMIFRHLNPWDLKSVRLASKAFSKLSAIVLFRKIYVSNHPRDIETMRDISNDQAVYSVVREVVYSVVGGPDLEWAFALESTAVRRRGFSIVQWGQRFDQQAYGDLIPTDADIIAAFFSKLSLVERLTVTNHWNSRFPTAGPRVRNWATPAIGRPLKLFKVRFIRDFKVNATMHRALSISGSNVEVVRLTHETWEIRGFPYPLNRDFTFMPFLLCEMEGINDYDAFRNMRELKLHFLNFAEYAALSQNVKPMEERLSDLLGAATALEELSLTFDISWGWTVAMALRVCYLPRIAFLWLSDMLIHTDYLATFWNRHRNTLINIDLDNVCLEGGTWPELAELFRSIKWQRPISISCFRLIELGNPGVLYYPIDWRSDGPFHPHPGSPNPA